MSTIDTIGRNAQPMDIAAANGSRSPFAERVGEFLRSLPARFVKRETRCVLLELSDQQLSDIGISREQALMEARRSFWS